MNRLAILIFLTTGWSAPAGELSDYYYKHARGDTIWAATSKSRSHQEVESTNHGIVEIGIERCGSIWGGPVYTFIAKSDGTFRYKGEKGVQRTGEYAGTIPIWQFHNLAKFIRDSGYMAFEDEYRREVTDNSTTFTSVVTNGVFTQGKRKVIRNYANSGPTTLWAIEELIDGLMAKAQWKSELPNAPEPVLPKSTRYDADPVLQLAYREFFRKGYSDAWEGKESLPVANPTSESDKARTLGYVDGMVAGRAALAKWHGTNSQPAGPAKQ